MIQKETPDSPMIGGQGVEVSKTLFYAHFQEAYDSVAGSAENLFSQTQTPMQEMLAMKWGCSLICTPAAR